jgi:hypothetical protein
MNELHDDRDRRSGVVLPARQTRAAAMAVTCTPADATLRASEPAPDVVELPAAVESWSVANVSAWLGTVGLAQHAEAFAAAGVDGAVLEGEFHRVGPNGAIWPSPLNETPYQKPELGPRFGPTLWNMCLAELDGTDLEEELGVGLDKGGVAIFRPPRAAVHRDFWHIWHYSNIPFIDPLRSIECHEAISMLPGVSIIT